MPSSSYPLVCVWSTGNAEDVQTSERSDGSRSGSRSPEVRREDGQDRHGDHTDLSVVMDALRHSGTHCSGLLRFMFRRKEEVKVEVKEIREGDRGKETEERKGG